MNPRKVSIGLLSLALSCGAATLAHAQEGPPPPPPYGGEPRPDPEMHAGFRDGYDNGRKDFNDHHTFVPEKAFRKNGRPKYHEEFGDRREGERAYHDGWIRGYDRGYHGGDPNY